MKENQLLALEVVLQAGQILLHNGAEIFRVQETMLRMASTFELENFHVYVISNGIFVSMANADGQYATTIRHIPLSAVHLGRVAAVNQLSREAEMGFYTPQSAKEKLEEIANLPYTAKKWQIIASGVGSGCFCYLLGGGLSDSLAAFGAGLILYIFILWAEEGHISKMMSNLFGAALVTLVGLIFLRLGLGKALDKMIIGSIIPLVPGVPFTNAIRDFFNSDYVSGIIRLIDALLVGCCIAIGVGGMLKIGHFILGGAF
jgi:uncharacterized membrane protein YjjP (DUF1212 family)